MWYAIDNGRAPMTFTAPFAHRPAYRKSNTTLQETGVKCN